MRTTKVMQLKSQEIVFQGVSQANMVNMTALLLVNINFTVAEHFLA
jgi:hypothetical protein